MSNKNNFIDIVSCALSGFEKYFIRQILKTGRGYYTGLYWYRLELSSDVVKKPEYREVVALHIKPYQITGEDVKKAVSKNIGKADKKIFNDYKDGFVDYDETTANFHKKISEHNDLSILNPQVVLVKKNPQEGPGWGVSSIVSKEKQCVLKKVIKKDWYFPNIGEANKTEENQCVNNERNIKNRDQIIKNLNQQIANALKEIQQTE